MMLEIKDNKTNNHLSHQLIKHKKNTMTYDVGNPGPGLRESQKYGGLKWAVGSQTYYNV